MTAPAPVKLGDDGTSRRRAQTGCASEIHSGTHTRRPRHMATVQTDDGTIEVPVSKITFGEDETPTGFVRQDKMNEVAGKRASRAYRAILSNLGLSPADYEDDEGNLDLDAIRREDAFRRLAESQGYKVNDDGSLSGTAAEDEVKSLRQQLSELQDAAEKKEQLSSEVERLRSVQAENSVLQHLDGVHEDMKDLVVRDAVGAMTWDPDEGRHVYTDENGDPVYVDGKPAGAEHAVEQLKEKRPSAWKDTSMQGGPSDTPGGSGSGKTLSRDEFEQMGPKKRKDFIDDGGRIE